MILILIPAALLGLAVGSFLNVCIYRVPRDLGVVTPRSFCPECGASIAWYDNVPVLSFLALRGKCRKCGQRVSRRYPLVELITALLFVGVVSRYGMTLTCLKWILFESILVVLFWTDWEERLLPDEFTWGGFGLGLVLAFFVHVPSPLGDLVLAPNRRYGSPLKALLAALLLALPVWALGAAYLALRKREGLGLGDVKLLLVLGSFLGLESGISAMLLASLAGSVVGVVMLIRDRRTALTYELPFGSFLCAGAAVLPLWKLLV